MKFIRIPPRSYIYYQILARCDTWLKDSRSVMQDIGAMGGLSAFISSASGVLSWGAFARLLIVWLGLKLILDWLREEISRLCQDASVDWQNHARMRFCWWCAAPKKPGNYACDRCDNTYIENL